MAATHMPQGHDLENYAEPGYHDPKWVAEEVGARPHHHTEPNATSPGEYVAPGNVVFDDENSE